MSYFRGPFWAAIFLSVIHGVTHAQPATVRDTSFFADTLRETEQLLVTQGFDPQLHFIRGMALAELGRYLEAADEFRWMLTQDPSLLRPRLELARLLFLMGQHDSARYNFEQVLANELPEEVRLNILSILARIREKTATLTMSLAFVSDSNPNQSTSAEAVEVGGLRCQISSNGRATKATGVRLAYDARVPLTDSSLWFARTSGELNQYSDQRLNFDYFQAVIGHNFQLRDGTVSIEAGAHEGFLGNAQLYSGGTVALSDFHQLRPDVGLKFTVTGQQLNYHDYPHLSGWQYGGAFQGGYAPSSVSRWEVGVGALRNSAAESPYAFFQYNLSGRYLREWVGGWITAIGLYGSLSRYDETDPVFLKQRHDTETRIDFELSNRQIRVWRFTPQLQIGWTERLSNLDFFSYSRVYARIGMTGDF